MTPYIYNRVKNTSKALKLRFCMPSHIGKGIGSFLDDVYKYDLTELLGTDNLNDPSGVILKSLENLKKITGAKNAAMITTGATTGVKAMLFLASKASGNTNEIIMDRFSHHSAIDAISLCDINAIYTTPNFIENTNIPLPPNKEEIEALLIKNKNIKAVFITSPNYYGQDADLKNIYSITKKYNVKLLVDNSHGTHYLFVKNPPYKISECCDMWVNSAHKTLPVLTGGALLLSNYIKREDLTEAISLFSTSSPSYLILSSLDYGLCYCDKINVRNLFCKTIENINKIKQKLSDIGYEIVNTSDPLRMVIKCLNAKKVLKQLYYNGIACEMADDNYLVLIISPLIKYNELNTLAKELKVLYNKSTEKLQKPIFLELNREISAKNAIFRESQHIDIQDAIGRISAECITIYPPSVPIVIPGQKISKNDVARIKAYTSICSIKVVK